MCVWCERYGQGYERWFFNPANYARRPYKVRKDEWEAAGPEAVAQGDHETVERLKDEAEQRAWTTHFGQVVTIEEVHRILEVAYPICLMTCACRRSMRGLPDGENFTCIGIGPGMYKWERWPETYRGGVHFRMGLLRRRPLRPSSWAGPGGTGA